MLGALSLLGACRQDMQDQPKYKALGYNEFFRDDRNSRPLVPNTIARGELRDDEAFYTGKIGKDEIDYFPVTVDKAFIERGQSRYEIYCTPCHGRLGNGLGMIVRRGFKQPPSYHIDRLRDIPVGHFYDVMTNGYGAMLNYAQQIQPRDRWAIAAYIRALQYSQNANINDLDPEQRKNIPVSTLRAPGSETPHIPEMQNFPEKPALIPGVPGATPSEKKQGKPAGSKSEPKTGAAQ
jgi:cytochrome c553